MLAVQAVLRYPVFMTKRLGAILCLVVLAATLGGCTKCGWIWEQGPRACHSDQTR